MPVYVPPTRNAWIKQTWEKNVPPVEPPFAGDWDPRVCTEFTKATCPAGFCEMNKQSHCRNNGKGRKRGPGLPPSDAELNALVERLRRSDDDGANALLTAVKNSRELAAATLISIKDNNEGPAAKKPAAAKPNLKQANPKQANPKKAAPAGPIGKNVFGIRAFGPGSSMPSARTRAARKDAANKRGAYAKAAPQRTPYTAMIDSAVKKPTCQEKVDALIKMANDVIDRKYSARGDASVYKMKARECNKEANQLHWKVTDLKHKVGQLKKRNQNLLMKARELAAQKKKDTRFLNRIANDLADENKQLKHNLQGQ